MTTTVVHVRDVLDRLKAGDPEVVYIGRWNRTHGLYGSVWANPYRIGRDGDRDEVVRLYRQRLAGFLRHRPALWTPALQRLRGKTLACWCKPEACHGDVLAELAEVA